MNPFLSKDLQKDLVLASASPRRRLILEGLGFELDVFAAGVEESDACGKDPLERAKELAGLKAERVRRLRPGSLIIAADTVVVCGGRAMGKPADAEEAGRMLRELSGREHEVITAVAVIDRSGCKLVDAERTKVSFRDIDDGDIDRYIETGEPFDKAGAYAIQGFASAFIERIEGCYFNIVGLPVARLFKMLKALEKGEMA